MGCDNIVARRKEFEIDRKRLQQHLGTDEGGRDEPGLGRIKEFGKVLKMKMDLENKIAGFGNILGGGEKLILKPTSVKPNNSLGSAENDETRTDHEPTPKGNLKNHSREKTNQLITGLNRH